VFVRRQEVRLGVLLAVLAALVAALVLHATRSSGNGPSPAPSLTAAEKVAAQAALARIKPPTTFKRYTSWRLAASPKSAVPCLSQPAICFGSHVVDRPLTSGSLGALLAKFHIRVGHASCADRAELPIGACNGSAAIPGFALGFIVEAERPVHPDQRPGTQVVLFAIKRS
jgi:hypothetical protein